MPHDEEAINIEIGIILLVIFLPACMLVIFSIMQKAGHKSSKTMSEENFSVIIPGIVIAIGTICASVSLAVILGFTFLLQCQQAGEARQPGVLFSYSRLSYNGREIGLTRLLMD